MTELRAGAGEGAAAGAGAGVSVHEVVGDEFFVRLVDAFYDGVAHEPRLRPLYPEKLEESRRDLAEFLAQYWGGPPVYSERKGHPRLRMRHAGFSIGPDERAAWMAAMTTAVESVVTAELADLADGGAEVRDRLLAYFEMASAHLLNAGPQP